MSKRPPGRGFLPTNHCDDSSGEWVEAARGDISEGASDSGCFLLIKLPLRSRRTISRVEALDITPMMAKQSKRICAGCCGR